MKRPDGAYKVPTTLEGFFAKFLSFLKPFHELSEKQIQLAAAFLAVRYELSKKITDDELLDAHVLSTEVKRVIKNKLGLTHANFQVTLGGLRKHGFIEGNRFNPMYIPNLSDEPQPKSYTMMFYFPIEYDRSGEEDI